MKFHSKSHSNNSINSNKSPKVLLSLSSKKPQKIFEKLNSPFSSC